MQSQSLSGQWQFRQMGTEKWLPAQVPGGVHTDLLALGMIPDPFTADNELRIQWVAEADWQYRRSFSVAPEVLTEDQVYLVCDGLDTLAGVSLNGKLLGKTDNMFRQYRWELKALLKPGENELAIDFPSTVKFAAARVGQKPTREVEQALQGGVFVRKSPCQFGWDWGPQLPPTGIWKDIRIEGYSLARLDDIHIRQCHSCGGAGVNVTAYVEALGASTPAMKVQLIITEPGGRKTWRSEAEVVDNQSTLSVTIDHPQMWFPNGYGARPLYKVEVALHSGKKGLDKRQYQLGLRQVELRQKPDEWGRSFTFIVNGIPIFAKGANWIPADSFPTRLTREKLEWLLRSTVDANMNMLRVWGGGLYESEEFYDLCDRFGILVWQECAFACNIYPLDEPDYVENVHQEVIQNVRRLRHRACLALWCGNNEMEQGWESWNWNKPEFQVSKEAYDKFFHHTLKGWVNELDPDHYYLPSSPTSETPFTDVNGQKQGDAHYWEVWHGRKPFSAYRSQYPRFMSEFGFQSLPPLETIKTYADRVDWNMNSYIMELHQRSGNGNGLIIGQMTDTFRMPKDFPSLVYLSMVLQAEGIRYGVEHWRRNKQRVSGTLIWQLNDCWPVASWSSLDYYGRWKALHYAARRFYAPVLLSIHDEGTRMAVHVTSDLTELWQGEVKWALETLSGETLGSGELPVAVHPLATKQVCMLDFDIPADKRRAMVFVAELWQGDELKTRSLATFAPNKHLELSDPHLRAKFNQQGEVLSIEVAAKSLARFVELSFEGLDVVFSDNYFDVPAGKTAVVTCSLPKGWTLEKMKQVFRMKSLYQSFT